MIDNFELHKALIYAFKTHPDLITIFTDLVYDYFNEIGKTTKFSFDDSSMSITVEGTFNDSSDKLKNKDRNVILDISILFANFVTDTVANDLYAFEFAEFGEDLRKMQKNVINTMALSCVTILDMCNENNFSYKINLHN